jgi:hypothetical protein
MKCENRFVALRFMLVWSILFVALSCTPVDSSDPPAASTLIETVRRTAEEAYPSFVARLPRTQLAHYGFTSPNELQRITVESPIPVQTLNPPLTKTFTPLTHKDIRPTQTWRVPLSVDETWRALLTVVRRGRAFSVVDLGASALAASLYRTSQSLPDDAVDAHLLRVYPLRKDYLGFRRKTARAPNYLDLHLAPDKAPRTAVPLPQEMLITHLNRVLKQRGQ